MIKPSMVLGFFVQATTRMHPLIKISLFVLVLITMGSFNGQWMLYVCSLMCLIATLKHKQHFLALLKRMRIFFISILLIYAYSTPGEYMWTNAVDFSPSYEGLSMGLMQIGRLLISLAALSLLLGAATKEALISALCTLLHPLQILGVNVHRFAARLLLTFDYVEQFATHHPDASNVKYFVFDELDMMTENSASTMHRDAISLENTPFGTIDWCVLGLLLVALVGWLSWKCFS